MSPTPQMHAFIVTYGRSGSTLLQNLLNALPGTCIRGENAGITSLLARAAIALDKIQPVASLREHAIQTGPTHPWYGAELHDWDAFGASLARALTEHVLRPPPGTVRAGFKEIRWHDTPDSFETTLDFLVRHFPKTRFVFNLRNHAAVMKSGWWRDQDPERAREKLECAEGLYAAYSAKHPDRCLTLRYEDYTAEPDRLKPLFDHVGAGWDPAMTRTILDERLTHLQRR